MEPSLFLGVGGGQAPVELLVAPGGERLPLGHLVGINFDVCIARVGWIAADTYGAVWAIRDGEWSTPTPLPGESWIRPAADPELLLVETRRRGLVAVDSLGRPVRSRMGPLRSRPMGELASGLVVLGDGLCDWDGDVAPLPLPEGVAAAAVVAGRVVVGDDGVDLHVWDARTEAISTHPGLGDAGIVIHDTTAEWVAFTHDQGIVTIDGDGRVALVAGGVGRYAQVVWARGGTLLVCAEDRGALLVDPASGATEPFVGLPRRAMPRADVTGRVDPAPFRERLLPPSGLLDEATARRLADASAARLRAAADAAGAGPEVLADAAGAVRLRSCLAPADPLVGGSRLGGRPDLPAGRRWPEWDGRPMAFLGQLRWDELAVALPDVGLPAEGLLLIFVGVDEDGWCPGDPEGVLVETAAAEGLVRAEWPDGLAEEARWDSAVPAPEPIWTPPGPYALEDALEPEVLEAFLERVDATGHQFAGHPATWQDDLIPAGHRLLVKIDGDGLMGTQFGDAGSLLITHPAGADLTGVVAGCRVELDSA